MQEQTVGLYIREQVSEQLEGQIRVAAGLIGRRWGAALHRGVGVSAAGAAVSEEEAAAASPGATLRLQSGVKVYKHRPTPKVLPAPPKEAGTGALAVISAGLTAPRGAEGRAEQPSPQMSPPSPST